MSHDISKWKCRYCGLDALDCESVTRPMIKCLVCLRIESFEDACARNVKIEVVNPQYMKEGYAFAIRPSDFIPKDWLLLKVTT